LSIVGGVRSPCILSKYFVRPRDGIAHPDAGRLRARPQFQVFWPVVVTYAVAVMDGFGWQQVAAEDLLHSDYVFEYVLTPPGARVIRGPEHDISGLVPGTPASPVAIRRPGHSPAVGAASRLALLRLSALAQISRTASRATQMPTRRLEPSATFGASSVNHESTISNIDLITKRNTLDRRKEFDNSPCWSWPVRYLRPTSSPAEVAST
jgi:hypothetical protein